MRRLLCALLLTCTFTVQAFAQVAVVVAADSPIERLDYREVVGIFLSKTSRFPNGSRAIPIDLRSSPVRDHFYREVAGRSPGQLNSYWATLVFTGKGRPPKGVDSKEVYIRMLEDAPGAIGFLPVDEVTDDFRVVYLFP